MTQPLSSAKPFSLTFCYCAEQQEFFVEHGWLKIPNAIDPKYLEEWMEDFWVRLGWDENDKSTWKEEYLKMPRHREVETEKFCPNAWKAMCELSISHP